MKEPPANDNPGPLSNKPSIDPKTGRIIGRPDNPDCDTPHIAGDGANSKLPDLPANVPPTGPAADPAEVPDGGMLISLPPSAAGGHTVSLTYIGASPPPGLSFGSQSGLIDRTLGQGQPLACSGGQVIGWKALLEQRAQLRRQGQVVVWTNGCFDLFHAGHLHSLRQARQQGDVLVVGVNSDASVRRLKGPGRPLLSLQDRTELLAGLACVAYVVVFDELTPAAALARLRPDVHCKGADYGPGGKAVPEAAVVASYGGRVCFLPLLPGVSTTELIRRARRLEVRDGGEA
jgi:D-glycero-beta-D-manno-heptose 1-phosphate adenylyltransferase